MAGPVIDLLDATGTRIGEAPTGTVDGIVRDLAVGQFQMASAVADLKLEDGRTYADVAGIRVVDEDATVLFTGTIRPLPDDDTAGIVVEGIDGATVTYTGWDAGWAALASRVAYPTPTTEAPWPDSHDVRSGVASTVAAGYVTANLGAGALAARQWPNVAIVDGAVGASSTWTARLQRLDQLVARVCTDGGITCRPTFDLDGTLRITLAGRRDRSATLVLNDRGDLASFTTRLRPLAATHVIAGGQGELTGRAFATAATAATGSNRFETFTNRSNLASTDELGTAAATELAAAGASRVFAAELAADALQALPFRRSYDIGDIVTIEAGDVRYQAVVEGVRISVTSNGASIVPVLGKPALNALSALIQSVADLRAQSAEIVT